MPERIATSIAGLTVVRNKAIGDARGWLGELLPGGAAHPDAKEGLGNIYLSVAVGRGVARAGHYHHRQSEVFFTVTGTALWAFRDYRENSPTFGSIQTVVFSDEEIPQGPAPLYHIGPEAMPGIVVPHGVYHVYWALTDEPVRVVCIATTPHDESDYVRLLPDEIPGLQAMVATYKVIL